jgi:hypothetical protein
MSNFGMGGGYANQALEQRRQRQAARYNDHGPEPKPEPSLWEKMASFMKNYTVSSAGVSDERDNVRDYKKNPLGTMEGDDNPWDASFLSGLAGYEEEQEMADIANVAADDTPKHVKSLMYDEERRSPPGGKLPRVPVRKTDEQIGLLKDAINKLEKKPNEIDFSPLASYLGMDARAFRPDMTKWEKEKAILGLKEKMAELKSEKELALEKQEYIMAREKIRQAEKRKDRELSLKRIRMQYGAKTEKQAKSLIKDQESLYAKMRTQNKDALNYLAYLRYDIEDPEDPEQKFKAKGKRDILHKEMIEVAKEIQQADPNLSFSEAYRIAVEESVTSEEEIQKRQDSGDVSSIPGL